MTSHPLDRAVAWMSRRSPALMLIVSGWIGYTVMSGLAGLS